MRAHKPFSKDGGVQVLLPPPQIWLVAHRENMILCFWVSCRALFFLAAACAFRSRPNSRRACLAPWRATSQNFRKASPSDHVRFAAASHLFLSPPLCVCFCVCCLCCGAALAMSQALGRRKQMQLVTWNIFWHRSHFGSRYTLGCCRHASLFGKMVRFKSHCDHFNVLPNSKGRPCN